MNAADDFRSEFGEDKWVAENVLLPASGVYLDIGCAHPQDGSNTAWLRARKWAGLGVDAEAGYAPFWKTPFMCAVVSCRDVVQFRFQRAAPYTAGVADSGGVMFPAVTVDRLIHLMGCEPDFLSLDIEGHEFDALKSLDFTKHRPLVIVSEYNTAGIGEDMRAKELLTAHGYRLAHTTTANHVFLRNE